MIYNSRVLKMSEEKQPINRRVVSTKSAQSYYSLTETGRRVAGRFKEIWGLKGKV